MKILMRKAIKDSLPKEVLKAKKSGFTPPLTIWINKPEYQKEIESALTNLTSEKIISHEWSNFYKRILKEPGKEEYKIRLFYYSIGIFFGKRELILDINHNTI